MTNSWLDEGRRALEEGDWAAAINGLRWASDAEPQNAGILLLLIEAYERAAATEDDPDLAQQAWNVCRALRDRALPMSPEERAAFRAAFVRVRERIVAARASGWTPPLPKEKIHTLF
jgi:hypothetical protein